MSIKKRTQLTLSVYVAFAKRIFCFGVKYDCTMIRYNNGLT